MRPHSWHAVHHHNLSFLILRFVALIIICFASAAASAQEVRPRTWEDGEGIFTFALENDYFIGEDDGYSNGFRLGWLSSESSMPGWIRNIGGYAPANDQSHKRIGISVGQSMFTPSDKVRRTYNPDDRPYAGWLYTSLGLIAETGRSIDTYQLTVGIVGPSALGEDVQDAIHSAIDDEQANGWDNQLKDEPGIVLTYDHKFKTANIYNPFGLSFDLTPNFGFNLGNIYTDARVGAMMRLGQDLPKDYGPPQIQPSLAGSDFFIPTRTLGWYLFAGVDATLVGRNIFLDGNTFRDGPSVDKKYLVGGAVAGIAATYGAARIAYSYAFRSEEFDGQPDSNNFGAITFSYRF